MGVKKTIQISKLASIIIYTIGTIGALVTIYAFFIYENKIDLQYEIISNTNVLDINAEISKLDILYDGNSLKEADNVLQVLSIKVINNGNADILKTYYDTNDRIGLKIEHGYIVENPEVLETSNPYLKSNLSITLDSLQNVKFSELIIESGEYYIIKILLLHKVYQPINIKPIGKIAGIKNIRVVNSPELESTKPFLKELASGGLLIQIARWFIYTLISVLLIILGIIGGEKITDYRDKTKRIRLIEEFKKSPGYSYTKLDDVIFNQYKEIGLLYIDVYFDLLDDEDHLNRRYESFKNKKDHKEAHSDYSKYASFFPKPDLSIISNMIRDGYISKKNERLIINDSLKVTFQKFMDFLEEHDALIDSRIQYKNMERIVDKKNIQK